jgi:hypothetical protein
MGETKLVHRLAALTVAVAALASLAGCAGTENIDDQTEHTNAWTDRMGAVLADEDGGQGGAGGGLPGRTFLMSVPSGTWDVLVACTGVDRVEFRVGIGDGGGQRSVDTQSVPCGAVGRLSMAYDASTVNPNSGSDDGAFVIRAARTGDSSSSGAWYATVVRHGFVPDILKG